MADLEKYGGITRKGTDSLLASDLERYGGTAVLRDVVQIEDWDTIEGLMAEIAKCCLICVTCRLAYMGSVLITIRAPLVKEKIARINDYWHYHWVEKEAHGITDGDLGSPKASRE